MKKKKLLNFIFVICLFASTIIPKVVHTMPPRSCSTVGEMMRDINWKEIYYVCNEELVPILHVCPGTHDHFCEHFGTCSTDIAACGDDPSDFGNCTCYHHSIYRRP